MDDIRDIDRSTLPQDAVVSLDNIAVRLRDRILLEGTSWNIRRGEQWAVMGPNGAGKSTLVRALAGELPVVRGRVIRRGAGGENSVGYVSFELHRRLIAQEEGRDDARYFSGDWEHQTTVRQLVGGIAADVGMADRAVRSLEILPLLDRTIRSLSTGEMRKALIARALARSPALLIFDEPFDGLDAPSRRHLLDLIGRIMAAGIQVVLVVHRLSEIPAEITHILHVENGGVAWQGTRQAFLDGARKERGKAAVVMLPGCDAPEKTPVLQAPPILIEMQGVTVRFGRRVIIDNLDWTVRRGENWTILGPNGAGKSTLLALIAGDHPQAYANEIHLFGRRRGSGESIWEIKAPIGMVSPEFQIRYRKTITALAVVLSGFYDSVGLFRRCTANERETALAWLRQLGMAGKADCPFPHLSHGEQRMVLLARAMVKSPVLLILDEPCQGLDAENRQRILSVIDAVGRDTPTHILNVTHHADEIPACTTHLLRFMKAPGGRYSLAAEESQPRQF